jgi:hypothetical protein
MKKIAYLILFFAYPLNYTMRYNFNVGLEATSKANYLFIFMICLGIGLMAYHEGKKEKDRGKKYLFYYTISVFNFSVIMTYLIDLLVDPIFQTGKVIWSIFITTIISLCIYFCKRKH